MFKALRTQRRNFKNNIHYVIILFLWDGSEFILQKKLNL